MRRYLLTLLVLCAGCGLSPEQEYERALRALDRQRERLDALRPAYDASYQEAMLRVCREIAGTTPDESAAAALQRMETMLNPSADGAEQADPAQPLDLDATIDNLLEAQQALAGQQEALSAPLLKAGEVMRKIKTAGTAEAKRFEEALSEMAPVQAYRRQEQRVERAQQRADEAEAALAGG